MLLAHGATLAGGSTPLTRHRNALVPLPQTQNPRQRPLNSPKMAMANIAARLRPLGNRVLVQKVAKEVKTAGGASCGGVAGSRGGVDRGGASETGSDIRCAAS